MERSGSTATLGPTKPTSRSGFSVLSASATLTSPAKVGELVCTTTRSWRRARGVTSLEGEAGRRGIDELTAGHDGGGLGQPGRIPVRADLPRRLVPSPGPSVETRVGRRIEEERAQHVDPAPSRHLQRRSSGTQGRVAEVRTPSQDARPQVQADPLQGGHEGGFPAWRRASRQRPAAAFVTQGQYAGSNSAGRGYAHVGPAQLEFVQQVVPPVTWHDVKKKKIAPDYPCLAARVGSGQGHDHIGGGHQLRDPVGETERRDPGRPGG